MATNIPVKYFNDTGKTDFQVVVFTKNFSTNTPETNYAAWQVLRAQSEVDFVYPAENEVGASYEQGGQVIISGPFTASPGSTWDVVQDTPTSTTILSEEKSAPSNPNNVIVVKNLKPKTWSGQNYDIGVYKSERLLVVQKDVRVLNQVDFLIKPKLFFGVTQNMYPGKVFTSLEILSGIKEFDMSQYPNGLRVTLTQASGGGAYAFTGSAM